MYDDFFYAKEGHIHCKDYLELYVPSSYFENGIAYNKGGSIETFGIVYAYPFLDGKAQDLCMMTLPIICEFMLYESKQTTIHVAGRAIDVMALQYLKDSRVMHQTIEKGRQVAESFLAMMLAGKVPHTLNYQDVINTWWRNLEMSGVSFQVPSKIYEIIIAAIYRDQHNGKRRYGQYYGTHPNASGYDYRTGSVREVVRNLSTFSGMVYEDISSMITSGIISARNEVEEPESPLEKIIHY